MFNVQLGSGEAFAVMWTVKSAAAYKDLSYKSLLQYNRNTNEKREQTRSETDLVPSEIACVDNSPGRMRWTAVWILQEAVLLADSWSMRHMRRVPSTSYAANSYRFLRILTLP
jgi:hypothetical protein